MVSSTPRPYFTPGEDPVPIVQEAGWSFYIHVSKNYLGFIPLYFIFRILCLYIIKNGGKETTGRPRRRWVDNIRMDLQEVGCGYVEWIGLAQDRDSWRTLVSAVMNLRVP